MKVASIVTAILVIALLAVSVVLVTTTLNSVAGVVLRNVGVLVVCIYYAIIFRLDKKPR
jgi:hypothetical protein